ncbi:MAG: PilZ domain-containing protein [Nitrosomonadales bacterium]|nr:PilZ domain-containing protein [Nitrosomonadales bacterium]
MMEETPTEAADIPSTEPAATPPANEPAPADETAPAGDSGIAGEIAPADDPAATRFRVKWRAAIVSGSGDSEVIYHGWLKDVSTAGTAIFSERPIPLLKSFDLYIEVPAMPGQKERILTLKARIVYAVYDGEAAEFRTGMEFTKFASANDQTFLATYLNNNCHPLSSPHLT